MTTGQPGNLPAVRDGGESLDIHYEAELDVRPEPGPPLPAALPEVQGDRLPVIPDWLQSREAFRAELARQGGRYGHHLKFHGFRAPVYLLKAAGWAAVGVLAVISRLVRWWWVTEQHSLRSQAVAGKDADAWMKLHREAKETRRIRGIALLALLGALVVLGVLAWQFAPWWGWLLLASGLLAVLARAGRPADRTIVSTAVVEPRFRKLTPDIVVRAYTAAGLCNPAKPGQELAFAARMARDGEGTACLVDLPYGKGLDDAVKARPQLASGLDVSVSQVFLHRDPTSHRRHKLWVADRDPLAVPVGRTPLLAGKVTDIWKPAPLGLDERGQLVKVLLMWISVLIGALPRQGKTFAARLLALYCALDPYVLLDVFDAKGSPDWRKFALVANACAFGMTPTRDGLPAEIFVNTLEGLKRDVQDRYNKLSELPPEVCPEGKLTREIARDPRYGMPVRVLVLDEFQEWYDLDPEISKHIASLLTFLIKVAPGAGVSLIGATQRPSGIGSGQVAQQFTSFRDNFAVRFGLRTSSWQVSELVLGAGAYSEGLDTSTLLPEYKGVGILRGATDASPTVRTYLADGRDAERILLAARALRERAGTLGGMAAGIEAETDARDVLADVLAVFDGEPAMHWAVLSARLEKRFPDRWADVSPDAISQQCRDLGVPSVDVKMFGRSRMGCRREAVEQARR